MERTQFPELFAKASKKGEELYEKLSKICIEEVGKTTDEASSVGEIQAVVPYMLIKAMGNIAAQSIAFASDIMAENKESRIAKSRVLSEMFIKIYNEILEDNLKNTASMPTTQEEIDKVMKNFPVGGPSDVN